VQVAQEAVEIFVSAGYKEYYVRWALRKCEGDLARAFAALESWGNHSHGPHFDRTAAQQAVAMHCTLPTAPCAKLPSPPKDQDDPAVLRSHAAEDIGAADQEEVNDDARGSENEDYDGEAEEVLAHTVYQAQQDPLACYDVDVKDEEGVLQELKAWLVAQADFQENSS
jgi:hypothetical protein